MMRARTPRWWIAVALVAWIGAGWLVDASRADDDDAPRPKAGAPIVGGPRLDHKAHMARGLKCLDCHQPTKGLDEKLQPGPASLDTCQRCHADIDKHKPVEERAATIFFDEQGRPRRQRAVLPFTGDVIWSHGPHTDVDCLSCHQEILETNVRRAKPLMDMDSCMACHHERQADNSCAACHKDIRSNTPPRTHDRAWTSNHGPIVKTAATEGERDTCAWCHTPDSCATCHATKRPASHGPTWVGEHGGLLRTAQRQGDATNCAFCHTEDGCQQCHTQKRPASHDAGWLAGHGPGLVAAQRNEEQVNCLFCHQQNQCDTCHTTVKPPSHDMTWRQGHADQLRSGGTPALDRCVLCHQDGAWCDTCHHEQRPASHDQGWIPGHGNVIAAGGRVALARCSFCHQDEQFCDDCHRSKPPPSHDALWTLRHGDVYMHGGRAGAQRCAFCHTEPSFCEDCHKDTPPQDHTNLFRLKTHGLLSAIDRDRCQACHQSDFCVRCHEETPPQSHGAGWSGTQSRHCIGCHFPISREPSCRVCHFNNPSHDTAPSQPPSHLPGLNCRLCHNSVGGGGAPPLAHPDNGISCELCHRR